MIPSPSPGLPTGAGEDQVVLRLVDPRVPRLLAVDHPLVAVALGVGLHVRRVRAVLRLGDAEGEAAAAEGQVVDPLGLLLVGAVLQHQQQADVVADDRVLVLQVVVQSESLRRQVLADHRHPEVGAVSPAELLREGVAVVPGGVGKPAGLAEQRLPLLVGQAAALPVGAGVLPAVVEEADVVVLLLERTDLPLDEVVELVEVRGKVLGQFEVHGGVRSADPTIVAGPVGLAQVLLQHLAARVARQHVDEVDAGRALELGQLLVAKAMISSGVASVSGALTTMALAVSPHFSWGTPMTATSAMPGCFISTFSTSAG